METRAHYAAVGAFVLTMIMLAFGAVLWLARGQLRPRTPATTSISAAR